jgi:transposase
MSYTVEQKVKGHVYLYRVESYWDKGKRQSRQRRVYLGKKDPLTGEIVSEAAAYQAQDLGAVFFLFEAAKQIGLLAAVQQSFPDLWAEVFALAFFKLCEGKAFYLCADWLDTVSFEPRPDLPSQRVSELLATLGERSEDRFRFTSRWTERYRASNRFIVFDITSISSYGRQLEYAEWGYNRDGEPLPQINLGVVYGEPSGLPLLYSLYPGSIHDVSTLKNLITELQVLSLEKTVFVLDKGFYSLTNLRHMHGMSHIIPLPLRNKKEGQLVEACCDSIQSVCHALPFGEQVLYSLAEPIELSGLSYRAYVYLDERKRVEERQRLIGQILEIERYVAAQGYSRKAEFDAFFAEHKPQFIKYFALSKRGSRFALKKNPEEIERTLKRAGMFVLITNSDLAAEEVLRLYRQKDGVEKCFDSLKNGLSGNRLRVHSGKTLEGLLFVEFVALILHAYIEHRLRETGLNRSVTVAELFWELRKLKKIRFGRKKTVITELSKRQRELFSAFQIHPPAAS